MSHAQSPQTNYRFENAPAHRQINEWCCRSTGVGQQQRSGFFKVQGF